MKKKVKIKKNEIIRPLDSSYKLLILIMFISTIICNFGLIFTIKKDKYVNDLDNLILGIIVTSIVTLATLVLIIYYYSWKVIAYKDRMIKYNIFNRKKVYYYKDLTDIIKEHSNIERETISFYFNKKRVLKFYITRGENTEILISSYYRYKSKHN